MELTNLQTSKNQNNKTYSAINRFGYDYPYDNVMHSEKKLKKHNKE